MTKVNYLRLLILSYAIALAVGQATKMNTDRGSNSTTENDSADSKGLSSFME